MQPIFAMQEELRRRAGKPKREFAVRSNATRRCWPRCEKSIGDGIEKALATKGKKERAAALYALSDKVVAALGEKFPDRAKEIIEACDDLVRDAAFGWRSSTTTSESTIASPPTSAM